MGKGNLVSRILSKVGDSIKHTTRALVLSAAIIASAVALDYNTKSARGATRDFQHLLILKTSLIQLIFQQKQHIMFD